MGGYKISTSMAERTIGKGGGIRGNRNSEDISGGLVTT